MKTNDTITTYKGFDEKLCCNPDNKSFQYEIGKEYEMDGNPVKCKNGFHSCENPLDVFIYYAPGESRYGQTGVYGKIDRDTIDSKIASSKIKIKVEVGLRQIIEDGIKFIFKKTNWSKENSTNQDSSGAQATGNSSGARATGNSSGAQATGDSSGARATGYRSGAQATGYSSGARATGNRSSAQATGNRSGAQATGFCSGAQATGFSSGAQATGDSSGAQATGDRSGAQATGNRSGAEATGDRPGAQDAGGSSGAQATGNSSMACVNGQESKAEITGDKPGFACGFGIQNKAKGTLNSWLVLSEWVEKNGEWMLKSVKSVKVDGKKIEADISYVLINGKFIKE